MATKYLDFTNGNDANDGSTWALAKKSITGLGTSQAGHTIKVAKSPAPVSIGNGTWTNASGTITLAAAQTLTIDNCESGWTAGANCTLSYPTAYVRQGTYSLQIATASGVTAAQELAYITFASKDLSAFTYLDCWIRLPDASDLGKVEFRLYSDVGRTTLIDTFVTPTQTITANIWLRQHLAKSGGGTCGADIKAISVWCNASYASKSIQIDNIFVTTAAGLSLWSLISKTSAETGGECPWFPINSIDGTTVIMGPCTPSSNAAVADWIGAMPFYGATETVTTYVRYPVVSIDVSTMYGTVAGGYADVVGGYDPSTDTRDGITYIWQPYLARYFTVNNQMLRMSYFGFASGLYCSGVTAIELTSIGSIICQSNYSLFISSASVGTLLQCNAIIGYNYPVYAGGGLAYITCRWILGGQYSIYMAAGACLYVTVTDYIYSQSYTLFSTAFSTMRLVGTAFCNKLIYLSNSMVLLDGITITDSSEVTGSGLVSCVTWLNHDGVAGETLIVASTYAFGNTVASPVYDTESFALRFYIASSSDGSAYRPYQYPLGMIHLKSGSTYTLKAQVRRTHDTQFIGLMADCQFVRGLTSKPIQYGSGSVDVWEEITLTISGHTEDAIVPIYLAMYGTSTGAKYVYLGQLTLDTDNPGLLTLSQFSGGLQPLPPSGGASPVTVGYFG